MGLWQGGQWDLPEIAVVVGGIVVAALLVGVAALVRFRRLCSRSGSFICTVRLVPGGRWHTGVGFYERDGISWYRARSLAWNPSRRWPRQDLELIERHSLASVGAPRLVLVNCLIAGHDVALTLSTATYEGFAAWLEAAPPHQHGMVL